MFRRIVSGIMFALLVVSMLTLTFNVQLVKASGTFYIRADGSIDPPTAPISSSDNVTYLLTDNIEFDESIIVERDNIVIDGVGYTVEGAGTGVGIHVIWRTNVTIKNVKVEMREYGIYLWESTHCSIIGNNITNNGWGIALYPHAYYNSIVGNNMTANYWCGIWGGEEHCSSNHNMISENNIAGSNTGIYLAGSRNNSIIGNNITGIGQTGIRLDWCSAFNILGNNVTHHQYGMCLYKSPNCNVVGNNITANHGYGIVLETSSNNCIHRNNFINNTNQANYNSTSTWDSGYPSGGNYWSDYGGTDLFRGVYQNETGSDGIGDTAYVIDIDNRDNYPLTKPYAGSYDIGVTKVTLSKTVVGQGYNLTVTVKILNYGINTETFNLTTYANSTVLKTISNISLTSRNFTIATFTWNTSDFAKGNYTIWAYATPVEGEVDVADNNKTADAQVKIGVPGDLNGDNLCDLLDLVKVAGRFGKVLGDLGYDPNCDLNDDSIIDLLDLVKVAMHFGETDP